MGNWTVKGSVTI